MSSFSIPAITAFVEATAGIIRLTTPVKKQNIQLWVFQDILLRDYF